MSIPSNPAGFSVGNSTSPTSKWTSDDYSFSDLPPISILSGCFRKAKEIDWGTCALRAALFAGGLAASGSMALAGLGMLSTPVGLAIALTIGAAVYLLADHMARGSSWSQKEYIKNFNKEYSMVNMGLNLGTGAYWVATSAIAPVTAWSVLGIAFGAGLILQSAALAYNFGSS